MGLLDARVGAGRMSDETARLEALRRAAEDLHLLPAPRRGEVPLLPAELDLYLEDARLYELARAALIGRFSEHAVELDSSIDRQIDETRAQDAEQQAVIDEFKAYRK